MAVLLNLQGSAYLAQMKEWAARDGVRLGASKSISPAPLLFSNLPFPLQISLPLFEAKAAVAVPTKYYQQLTVDGVQLRNDWAHDFCRSIAFDGDSLVLVSQAIAKKPEAEVFLGYLAVKFSNGEFSFSDLGNGKFEAAVHGVKKDGVNLLDNSPASHTFSFSFQHNPTKPATISSTSFRASGLASSVYGQHGGLAHASDESVITVAHLEPHPYLLSEHAHFGYASRHDFINDASALLASYLKNK
ncbi:MAG: hypothetical protein WC759_05685 [Candidatus Micrarchaeia archaeon]|jgi:hypothetical protein